MAFWNLEQVVQGSDAAADFGVLVYAGGLVHAGRQVLSADSSHSGNFRSHPGPIGEARGGQTVSTSSPRLTVNCCLPLRECH